ncbi:hypothetical protein OBV_44870 [Oscillibacter valericigenes Sjm18-20]|nr:hypothetical protein OBV_44870 [Oscillibacter valericigenes Sjm18-20]
MVKGRKYPAESGNHRDLDLGQEYRAVRRVRFVPYHPAFGGLREKRGVPQMTKLRHILRDKAGNGFPLVVAITLALVIILCGVMEFFRLNVIAAGVKEALEDTIIVTVNDNYADVYHGVREGYSGGYQPDGSSFSYSVKTGDIYGYMDGLLGTKNVGGSHVKYAGDALEYRLSGLDVTIRNAPLAPSSPKNAQRFEADAVIWLEVPVYFGGKELAPMKIKLKVQAGYTEVF